MEPFILVLGVAGAIAGAGVALDRWSRRRSRHAWASASERLGLELASDDFDFGGAVAEVELRVRAMRVGAGDDADNAAYHTVVEASSAVVAGPSYRFCSAKASFQRPGPDVEPVVLGDPSFDDAYHLETDEPRSFARLFTPERRRALAALPTGMWLEGGGGEVSVRWPGIASHEPSLNAAIDLVLDLAAVGVDLMATLRSLEGITLAPAMPTLLDAPLANFMEVIGVPLEAFFSGRRARQPAVYELALERCLVSLQVVYWRGTPGISIQVPCEREVPPFVVRWDESGARHAADEVSEVVEGRPPGGGEALLKYDGEHARLFVRGSDSATLLSQAIYLEDFATRLPSKGAFR